MWTATKTSSKGLSNGQAYQEVVYTNGVDSVVEVYRTPVIAPDWPDSIARARLDQLNALDVSVLKVGALDPKPVVVVTLPTQAEIDRLDFLAKLRVWQKLKKEVDSGFSKTTTQADVDSAYAAVKSAYLPEYGVFL